MGALCEIGCPEFWTPPWVRKPKHNGIHPRGEPPLDGSLPVLDGCKVNGTGKLLIGLVRENHSESPFSGYVKVKQLGEKLR